MLIVGRKPGNLSSLCLFCIYYNLMMLDLQEMKINQRS